VLKPSILWVVPTVALLTGCANAPQTRPASASDCGFHFAGGSGALGLLGAMGAFDRPAGADCRRPVYGANSSLDPPPATLPVAEGTPAQFPQAPALPPLQDMRPRLLVPGGGGMLMELGGDNPQLMVPAGGGAFMALP
jgi:hypothetical protein